MAKDKIEQQKDESWSGECGLHTELDRCGPFVTTQHLTRKSAKEALAEHAKQHAPADE